MSDKKEKRRVALDDLKDDGKLLKIAFLRLGRDIIRLLSSLEFPGFSAADIGDGCQKVLSKGGAVKKFPWRKLVWLIVPVIVVVLVVKMCDGSSSVETDTDDAPKKPYAFNRVPKVERPEVPHKLGVGISYKRNFNDLNDTHLAAARKIGIKTLQSRDEAENASRKIVEIKDYDAYVVDELTHSIPFLVPEAAALLSAIGNNFQDSLVMKHLPPHKIIVTSVLRTRNDIKRLKRGNVNSSENSAHCYATTFDISWKRFFSEEGETTENATKLKLVLAEVLRDLKAEGSCYVKHEVKQACFHITARDFPKE